MMEAARTSETSVDIQLRTRQCIPEDSELHNLLIFTNYSLQYQTFDSLVFYEFGSLDYVASNERMIKDLI
jgi:hypothetical protein